MMAESYSQVMIRRGSVLKAVLLVTLTLPLIQAESKTAFDLKPVAGLSVDVIVQFRHPVTNSDHNKVHSRGGALNRELRTINGASYRLPAEALTALAADAGVAYVSPDRGVHASLDYSKETIQATLAWQAGIDSGDVGIAVLDSGISTVPDLNGAGRHTSSRIAYSESFVKGSANTNDQFGHGTHVAGIVAGDGYESTGAQYTYTFLGVAPHAQLINLRVLDENGMGTDSAVIQAIERAISLKAKYNIRVINLSLGRRVFESYTQDPLCQAVEAAWRAGIVVVAAAGNDGRDNSLHTSGYGTINAPGNDPYVITVGAMKTMDTASRSDDQIASYSSKGPTLIDHIVKPDLVAPGNRIVSLRSPDGALDVGYPQNLIPYSAYTRSANNRPSSFYFQLSGTSMSTAMVSGAAALLIGKEPSLTPDQVKARLMKSASKTFPAVSLATDAITGAVYRSEYDIFTVGAGYLDVWAALNGDDPPSGSAKSPTANYDALTGSVTVVSDSSVVWGSSPSWSTSVVWGDNVFVNYSSVVWGDAVVWGDITSQGFSVIWGTSVVWGDALIGVPASASPVDVLIQGEP